MASPASIGGHPIHPMIIPFPIALWVFSLVADIIYLWRGNPLWRDWIAFYTLLGGIIGAALTAIPGRYEQGLYRTRATDRFGALPLFRGIPSYTAHNIRSEFAAVFSF